MDQQNKPFRIQGDSPWDILVSAGPSDVDAYLANRAAKGFNTLLMELIEHKSYVSSSPAPANRNGDLPFTSKLGGGAYTGASDLADLATPNDRYFQYVDTVLAKMAGRDMLALLTPLYVGFGAATTQSSANEGWSADMNASSSASCYKYGQYLGDRYRNQKNIAWVDGGDAFLQSSSNIAMCAQQVIQGIKDGKGSGGSAVLHTTHWSRGHLSTDDPSFAVQLNSVYVDPTTVVSLCRKAYASSPRLPTYVIEAYYEGEHSMTRTQLRKQDYQAALSCIGGYVFGNSPLWQFATGWQSSMDADGSKDWQRAGALLDAIAWQNLVPSDLGTLAGTTLVTGGDITAAASGTALVAYVPSSGTGSSAVNVNMTVLAGSARARWYNPANGTYTDISGGAYTLPNSGTRSFTTPGDNGTGSNDWVLVLDVANSAVNFNYEGLWWAAPAGSESGWGINFAHQDDVIFATWFTYDVSGNAWWLTMTANRNADGSFSGTLYQTNGPAFNAVPFSPTQVTNTAVGSGSLTFASADTGTFVYTVDGVPQTKAITLQVFGPLPTCIWGAQPDLTKATNFQDLWWAAPAGMESGWGINLTHQGTTIFATWFTYDVTHKPLWYSVTASQTTPNTFTGTLYRTVGPAFSAVPFDSTIVQRTPVGTATLAFSDGNNGSFSYQVNDGANFANQSKAITRQVLRNPGTACE